MRHANALEQPRMANTTNMSNRWDLLLKVASLACTAVLLPGIGWAWKTGQDISDVRRRVDLLAASFEHQQAKESAVADELRQLRVSVESMRADVLQRLSKVETKLEHK